MRAILSSLAVVLLAVCCAIAFSLAEAQANVEYNEVLTGEFPWYARLFSFPFVLISPAAVFGLTLCCIGRVFLKHPAPQVTSLIAALALVIWAFWPNPFSKYTPLEARLHGLIDRAKAMGTIPKLEEWALKIGRTRSEFNQRNLKEHELPEFLAELSVDGIGDPEVFVGHAFDSDEQVIVIEFGGGFGHWCLILGMEGYLTNSFATRSIRVTDQIIGTYY